MNIKEKVLGIFSRYKKISNPPYEYDFLISLKKDEYPLYLKKIFYYMIGKTLNLKNPKTFNEKIQWLKLYDLTPLKTRLTDKVLVRDWISDKIGEKYLKPVLWIGKSFNDIPFEQLPNRFIIKTNHGCKWHYKIKDKEKFLQIDELYQHVKIKFDVWMQQSFYPWAGFELQYKDIKPQILIEELLLDDNNLEPIEYEIYCFNGVAKIFQKIKYSMPVECSVYNENYEEIDLKFNPVYTTISEKANDTLKKAVALSEILAKEFKLVRVDWLIYKDKLYFNEMTFTPFSGFFNFANEQHDIYLGSLLKLEKR